MYFAFFHVAFPLRECDVTGYKINISIKGYGEINSVVFNNEKGDLVIDQIPFGFEAKICPSELFH